MPRLFLIGMPGSGKSTIGKLLADKMELPFFDLDEAIVKTDGRSIPELFEQEGEVFFRKVESECLESIIKENESFVLATGGGAPCYHNGIELMNKNGTTIFIDVSPEVLVERVAKQEVRPLLKEDPSGRIKKLYTERLPVYLEAQMQIQANGLSVQELVEYIVGII